MSVALRELASVFFWTGYFAGPFGLGIGVAHSDLVIAMDREETLHRGSLQFSDTARAEDYGG